MRRSARWRLGWCSKKRCRPPWWRAAVSAAGRRGAGAGRTREARVAGLSGARRSAVTWGIVESDPAKSKEEDTERIFIRGVPIHNYDEETLRDVKKNSSMILFKNNPS